MQAAEGRLTYAPLLPSRLWASLCSREASATAAELLTPDQDSLAVLQSHLLTQQNKLQKYMDSLAANIQNSVPGQVRCTPSG